jgi:hypothetical protein
MSQSSEPTQSPETATTEPAQEAKKDPTKWWLNPSTKRYCKVGGLVWRRAVKDLNSVKLESSQPAQPPPTPAQPANNLKLQDVNELMKRQLMNEASDVVLQNARKLADSDDMTDAELNAMLKKLLIAKLTGGAKSPRKKTKKPAKKKAKRKARFRVVMPSSSEESSDSSDSD